MSYVKLINSLKVISAEAPQIKVAKLLNYHLYKPNPFESSSLSLTKGQIIKLKSDAFNSTFQSNAKSKFYDNIPLPNILQRHCQEQNINMINHSPVGKITGLKMQAKGRKGSRSMTFSVGHGRLGVGDHSNSKVDYGMSDFVGKMGSTGIKILVIELFALFSSFFMRFDFGILWTASAMFLGVGVWLFSSGFLLTRLELESISVCHHSVGCSTPRFNKTVLIIIDALRYDFTLLDSANQAPYLNKLPVLNTSNGFLARARADPPTTTLQRLKAITTGNLPTFVDAGSNFNSDAINEDNLILQYKNANKTIFFMGDDTWMGLYPNSFKKAWPYPSFDVWDLHTVDNGVIKHLFPVLQGEEGTWDLCVAHFLGVDHAGHRYGPEHPEMAKKLTQMNSVLEDVFDQVDEETLVIVMGDHGMDPKGDHGGDSENELSAGLYLYSKKPLTLSDSTWDKLYEGLDSIEFDSDEPLVSLESKRTFPQIDINPTIALLAGLPIPFGNLGSIIPELFYHSNNNSPIEALENLVFQARSNAHQIEKYISEYSILRSWASDSLKDLKTHFKSAEAFYEALKTSKNYDDDLIQSYFKYTIYSRKALTSARKIWARFDVSLIFMGIFILLSTCFLFIASFGLNLSIANIFKDSYWKMSASALLFSLIGGSKYFTQFMSLYVEEDAAQIWYHQAAFLGLIGPIIFTFLNVLIRLRPNKWTFKWMSQPPNEMSILASVLGIMYIITPASDSFTVYEDSSTLYLLQSFALFNILHSFSIQNSKIREKMITHSIFIMIITRISAYSTICREEQHPYCTPTFNFSPSSSLASPNSALLLVFATWLMLWRSHRIIAKLSPTTNQHTVAFTFIGVGFLLSNIYWILDTIEGHDLIPTWRDIVTITKLKVGSFGFPIIIFISLTMWMRDNISSFGKNNDSFGKSYYIFVKIVFMMLNMIQKPMGGIMLCLAFISLQTVLEIFCLWRDIPTSSPRTQNGLDKNLVYSYIIFLFLIGQRYFFSTGHQRALSSIQYEIGFVGQETVNWILSPLFVLFNTFGSQIFSAFFCPLLIVWKRKSKPEELLWLLNAMIILYMLNATISITFAGHFRRHLMVWRVFAPKFLFTVVETIVCMICVAISKLILKIIKSND